jgi:hypothetical protein
MIVKKTKQLGNFKKGINLYVPKKIIVPAAPSGLPAASTSSIVVVGAEEVISGTYNAQGYEDLVAVFDAGSFFAGSAPFYSITQAGENAPLYFFLGPNASLLNFEGENYYLNGSNWKIFRLFDNEGLAVEEIGTNPSTNADYIPTSGWTPSITITAA